MPDPDRKTISATQVPALYNASPYLTRFMLYHFLKGAPETRDATDRMRWGTKMQPLVLEQVQADLNLEVNANFSHRYVRLAGGPLGCTVDATTICPDRGPGAIEAKCVFDYGVWMREWGGGAQPPKHYELQLQTQLHVGDGVKPFAWGVIAAWVCGEMHYFERRHDDDVGESLEREAANFFNLVLHNHEPEPFAPALEAPLLNKLFPPVKGRELDLRTDAAGRTWAQLARDYKNWKASENFYAKAADDARYRLRGLARDNAVVLLPEGVTLKLSERHVKEHVRKASTYTAIAVELADAEPTQPAELPDGSPV